MFLHRVHIDHRGKEARRDLANPYELHSTLCRAFSAPDSKCPEGEFLWRLEPESDRQGRPRVLIQSRSLPDWSRIGIRGWLAEEPEPAIDLAERLRLDEVKLGQRYRFRLRANPCVTRQGKRMGLMRLDEQETWISKKGERHGYSLQTFPSLDLEEGSRQRVDVRVSQEQMLCGRKRADENHEIRIFSVLFDGILTVMDPDGFRQALATGIGHGKSMGLGLLSVVPMSNG